jgi:hypothetical protein
MRTSSKDAYISTQATSTKGQLRNRRHAFWNKKSVFTAPTAFGDGVFKLYDCGSMIGLLDVDTGFLALVEVGGKIQPASDQVYLVKFDVPFDIDYDDGIFKFGECIEINTKEFWDGGEE